jgi:glyoxylase-like metal-dependent hydrolase (beta-lactamase superfamily II)
LKYEIIQIRARFSCYLIKTEAGFVLIDTDVPPARERFERELMRAGCTPGNLKLIILTNGGLDAAGNCAYIRDKYGTKVAVHKADAEKLDKKIDYFPKREYKSPVGKILEVLLVKPLAMKMIAGRDLFKPDLCIDEDFDLSAYGFNGRIIHVPGYTMGSIAILTLEGEFFSGNTIMNQMGMYIPAYVLTSYSELYRSLQKISQLNIRTVYPCMGNPFPFARLQKALQKMKI